MKPEQNNDQDQDFQLNIILPVISLLICFVLGLNFLIAGVITIIAIFIGLSLDIIISNKSTEYYSKIVEIQDMARKILDHYEPKKEKDINIIETNNDATEDILTEIARSEDYHSKSEPSISTEQLEITKIDDNSKFLDDIASLAENVQTDVAKIENKANDKEIVEFNIENEKECELINEISGINSEFSKAISEIWTNPQESTKEEIENIVEKAKSEISPINNKEKDIESKKISFLEFKEIIANKEIVYNCKLCKKNIKAEIDRISSESFETVSFSEDNYLFRFNISHINDSKDYLHIQTIIVDSEGKYKSTDAQWKFEITENNQNNILENIKNNELDLKEVVMS